MTDTTSTEAVAAYLADARKNWDAFGVGIPAFALLAAVEAVLGDHDNLPVFISADECDHPEPSGIDPAALREWDADHPLGAGDVGRICVLTDIGRYCPACTLLVYEDDPVGDSYVDASNCIVLPALAAALLGEGSDGAQTT
jgi:hypothetical protein